MTYDFSKLVKIGSKILLKNGGCVVKMVGDEPIVLPANTFRFQWENPIENPVTDTRFTLTQVDDKTWDYTVLDEYLKSGGLFSAKFKDLSNKVKLIAVGDISDITNMSGMFNGCTSLTTVSLFDTSNVTDMSGMFSGCISLTTVPLFDTSNVTIMDSMFLECMALTTVPLFDTQKVTTMGTMFKTCTSLTTVPLFDTSNVTNMGGMFYDCIKVESGAMSFYQQASATGKVTNHGETFSNCGKYTETGLAELQQIPKDWGGLLEEGDSVIIGGKTYRTVTIGNQTWLAENLKFESTNAKIINNEFYYTNEDAKSIANQIDGWHLPSMDEFKTMLSPTSIVETWNGDEAREYIYEDCANKVKSLDFTNGTNETGFNMKALKRVNSNETIVEEMNNFKTGSKTEYGCLHTSTPDPDGYNGWYMCAAFNDQNNVQMANVNGWYLNIRLVKDN